MKKEEIHFISLAEAAKMTNYSQDYISLLCRQGKLKAEKLGRNWVTTKDWVYSYVDNTSGRGESMVPVKVKTAAIVEADKKTEEKKEKNKTRKPLYFGQSVLEMAFFCFACMIWFINIFLVVSFLQSGDMGFSAAQTSASSSQNIPANNSAAVQSVDTTQPSNEQIGSGQEALQSLSAFEKETDPAILKQREDEIKAKFSGDIEMVIYKNFAVLSYKENPDQKFLYLMNQ
jgi:hypothetical protein